MPRLIKETRPKARKVHRCQAFEILQDLYPLDMPDWWTHNEWECLKEARRVYGKISPGETYVRQTCELYGDIYTFKAKPELHAICLKYDLYEMHY